MEGLVEAVVLRGAVAEATAQDRADVVLLLLIHLGASREAGDSLRAGHVVGGAGWALGPSSRLVGSQRRVLASIVWLLATTHGLWLALGGLTWGRHERMRALGAAKVVALARVCAHRGRELSRVVKLRGGLGWSCI